LKKLQISFDNFLNEEPLHEVFKQSPILVDEEFTLEGEGLVRNLVMTEEKCGECGDDCGECGDVCGECGDVCGECGDDCGECGDDCGEMWRGLWRMWRRVSHTYI
jgi:hypothetical protein